MQDNTSNTTYKWEPGLLLSNGTSRQQILDIHTASGRIEKKLQFSFTSIGAHKVHRSNCNKMLLKDPKCTSSFLLFQVLSTPKSLIHWYKRAVYYIVMYFIVEKYTYLHDCIVLYILVIVIFVLNHRFEMF